MAEVRRIFTDEEIGQFLDELERTKFLAPIDTDLELDDSDDPEEDLWLDNPVLAAEELLRFSRIRQLLQQ